MAEMQYHLLYRVLCRHPEAIDRGLKSRITPVQGDISLAASRKCLHGGLNRSGFDIRMCILIRVCLMGSRP